MVSIVRKNTIEKTKLVNLLICLCVCMQERERGLNVSIKAERSDQLHTVHI